MPFNTPLGNPVRSVRKTPIWYPSIKTILLDQISVCCFLLTLIKASFHRVDTLDVIGFKKGVSQRYKCIEHDRVHVFTCVVR